MRSPAFDNCGKNGMAVKVSQLKNGNRKFSFDLNGTDSKSVLGAYFFRQFEVEIGKNGAAKLSAIPADGKICPTSELRKVIPWIGKQGAKTLEHDFTDSINSLGEHANLAPGMAIPLKTWKKMLPTSESLLLVVDDLHG
ncbi:MAG: hypothetical protein NT051_03330 [Candidatus Micrarchaeota archaeon]|nr:hypothetical protein [Candidatus Micrarchaeota archaeon]